jgi:hypothetical protein
VSAPHSMARSGRPVCVHCGAKYGQRHTHTVTVKDGEVYEGFLQLVTRGSTRRRANGERVWDAEVWDGKSWMGGYEPFCTLRCALSYARKAYAGRTAK